MLTDANKTVPQLNKLCVDVYCILGNFHCLWVCYPVLCVRGKVYSLVISVFNLYFVLQGSSVSK